MKITSNTRSWQRRGARVGLYDTVSRTESPEIRTTEVIFPSFLSRFQSSIRTLAPTGITPSGSHVLRQDPDVVVIGEMRDLETIETALQAAETGHLVIATLHTPDTLQTIQRIYSVFPSGQQNSITYQLANSLQAIIAQKLLPRATGDGRVLASEICISTPAVRNHIREQQVHMLYSEMQTGRRHQMQTMDQVLLDLYQRGEIAYDIALSNARDQDFIRHKTGEET